MFEQEWDSRSLFGWEQFIPRIYGEQELQEDSEEQKQAKNKKKELYCKFCNKTFLNENVFHFHKKGKRHIKAVNSLTGEEAQEAVD